MIPVVTARDAGISTSIPTTQHRTSGLENEWMDGRKTPYCNGTYGSQALKIFVLVGYAVISF